MKYALFIFFYILSNIVFSQITFYQDIFKGGVSSYTKANNGYGVEFNDSLYSASPLPSSTLRKAYLFIVAVESDSITITFDNKEYFIDSNNSISNIFFSTQINSNIRNASIYCVDLTANFSQNNNWHNLNIPDFSEQSLYSGTKFLASTLFTSYNDSNLPQISTTAIINNQDVNAVNIYEINQLNPINNSLPVALSVVGSYFCQPSCSCDGSYIDVNNNNLGLLVGDEPNAALSTCSGVYSCYSYYNSTINSLDNDIPNSYMNGTDALADIKSYVNYGDTSVSVKFTYQSPNNPQASPLTNPIRYISLAYSTKCDTLKSYLTTSDTTICAGESLVLQVGGLEQYSYAWRYRGEVVSTDTALSIAPEHNRLYSILVSDTNGCSKTEIINVKVNPKPSFATTISNAICPNNNGSIVLDSLQGVAPPFRFKKDNGNWQTAPVYGYLPQGNYNISLRDTNGCIATQNVTVESVNNSIADFSFANPLPFVPTEVVFENQSQNTSEYQWLVNGVNADNTENLAYLFQQEGSYQITLIASQPNGLCVDTITKTITLNSEYYFYVPTTINGEIVVFSNGYQSVNFSLVNALGQQIFSKNTTITNSEHLILNHKKIAKGIYFYQAEAVKDNGEIVVFSGKVLF